MEFMTELQNYLTKDPEASIYGSLKLIAKSCIKKKISIISIEHVEFGKSSEGVYFHEVYKLEFSQSLFFIGELTESPFRAQRLEDQPEIESSKKIYAIRLEIKAKCKSKKAQHVLLICDENFKNQVY